jgi:IS4 transposase
MLFEPLFERFTEGTPLSVMTRVLLENVLQPEPLDELFERHADKQYTRDLLFSSMVQVMALVACRLYKSPRAVYLDQPELFGVVLKCFYEKLQRLELTIMRELLRDNARRLGSVIVQMGGQLPELLPGYRAKILDGNALAGTHHRIKELRGVNSAALPGKTLVVLDPELGLAIDVFPCEDGHAQERSLLPDVLATVEAGDLWIEDRNFCTIGFIFGVKRRRAAVLVREHKNLPWKALSELRYVGRVETGVVYEQQVQIEQDEPSEDGEPKTLKLRRIVVRLDEPTRDGETEVALLTNVEQVSALKLAQLYLKRWTIEGLFNVLTMTLKCEQSGLGYPKAALFAFCVTLLAYNVLATVKAALRSVHGSKKVEEEVSLPLITEHVLRKYEGMMVGLPPQEWEQFQDMKVKDLAGCLRKLAAKVCLEKFRKAPTRPKKKAKQKAPFDPNTPHVATARLLAERRKKE